MTYKNRRTGFVFDSPCEVKGEEWECLTPSSLKKEEDKPVKPKRIKK